MSDLYKDALLEAKKVREIAEEDAKKSIVEAITPFVKKMITKQISESMDGSGFFLEQDDEEGLEADASLQPPTDAAQPPQPTADTSTAPETMDPTSLGGEGGDMLGDMSTSAPIESDTDQIGATMPDEEGKITVDFEDLFKGTEETLGIEDESDTLGLETSGETGLEGLGEEPPLPGAELGLEEPSPEVPGGGEQGLQIPTDEEEAPLSVESRNYKKFKNSLNEVSEKIDHVFFKESVNELVNESLKNRLFGLVEQLDTMKENGSLTKKMLKINENKLEFLFLKLKEANMTNSYIEKDQKDKGMTSLREFAAKLFEADSTYAEDGDREGTNQPTTISGKHAANVSGVDPNVGSTEDLDAKESDGNSGGLNEEMEPGSAGSVDFEALPGTDPKPGAAKHWDEGEPDLDEKNQDKVIEEALDSLSEEIEAEGHAGFGDTSEDPSVEFEVDEKEIAEAVERLQKESIRRKMKALKEASEGKGGTDSWEDGEPEGGKDPSMDKLKESMGLFEDDEEEEDMGDMEMDDMEDMGDEVPMGDEDMDMDMMGDEGEDMMSGEMSGMDDDLVFSIDMPDEVEDALEGVDMDDFDISVIDMNVGEEDGDMDMDDGMGDEEVPMDDDMGDEDMDMDVDMAGEEEEEEVPGVEESAVYESKYRKAAKLYKEAKSKTNKLNADLKEANLFIAKNVYFTKFLQRGDLSKSNLKKIVEHLDSAKTVKEAKSIYNKIKTVLSESTVKSSNKLVGSSSRVTKPGSVSLNENVTRKAGTSSDPVVSTPERWQQLAGIKPKKQG